MITPEQFDAVRAGVEDLLAFGEPRVPGGCKIPADWTPDELRTIAEALRRASGKVHVLQMAHWDQGGPLVRVFATHEAAEAAAIAVFNEMMLEDLNWRIEEVAELKPRKPVDKIEQIARTIAWANEKFECTADCQITTVVLEGARC